MSKFGFSIEPNEWGKIECVAMEEGKNITFFITETDLHRMLSSIHRWKAKQHDITAAYGTDCRNGSCDV